MKIKRAASLVSMMPNKLMIVTLSKEEALSLWYFMDAETRLPITKQMLRHHLAEECGVFAQQLNAVMRSSTIAETLVMESSESKSTNITLQEARGLISNVTNSSRDWLLPFCHTMDCEEAEFVWRWALKERWLSLKNRMRKWVLVQLGIEASAISTERLIHALYDGDDVEELISLDTQCKLSKWSNVTLETPDKWWIVKNPHTLRILMPTKLGYVARTRRGEIDAEVTDWAKDKTGDNVIWSWVDDDTLIRLDTTDKQSVYSWGDSVTLLQLYPHASILIEHGDRFHILSSGSVELFAQALRIRRVGDAHYELAIGFSDGDTIEETTSFVLHPLPFELTELLKRKQINYHYGRDWHDIPEGVVVACSLYWKAGEDSGWRLRYNELKSNKGRSDIDQVLDYNVLVGEANE
tara:strand:+ start:179 stop:1405 length:1227 start_codon:yes stop_codon:yes gene_type:complete